MKVCSTCKAAKDESEFSRNAGKKDGLHNQCKGCKKKHQDEWYQRHKSEHKRRAKLCNDRVRKETRAYVDKYLREHPCVDCGEDDVIVLEFDHVRGNKLKAVSKMLRDSYVLSAVVKEISKCEVRCANCHRRATHQRRVASFNGEAVGS